MEKQKTIIVINAGSSSLKFQVFLQEGFFVKASGQISGIGTEEVKFVLKNSDGDNLKKDTLEDLSRDDIISFLLTTLLETFPEIEIVAAGHRVVHGSTKYLKPVVIDDEVINELKKIQGLSPIHMPHNIKPMEILRDRYPNVKQVACFDTAFHSSNPSFTRKYALPKELIEEDKLIRYGFHGLSYEYIATKLKKDYPEVADKRVIICHLGAGASLCALKEGKSYTTTMGFTPLDGLVMGSRTGSIDAGILLHLMNTKGYSAKDLEELLYYKSGVLGLSGISSDFYTLETSKEEDAKEAIRVFVFNLQKAIGSLIVALGGLDAIVFTAGVGENAFPIRKEVVEALKFLGAEIDDDKNKAKEEVFSTDASKVKLLTLPTNEELMIANHTANLLK